MATAGERARKESPFVPLNKEDSLLGIRVFFVLFVCTYLPEMDFVITMYRL
jgi:hypothetical protein